LPAFAVRFAVVGADAEADDDSLVTRLRAGHLSALGEAYDAHHTHVRAFARRLLGDESAAEDLVQETFLTLPKAIGRFRGESSLRTLLVSIAVRHVSHHVRAAARRRLTMARLAGSASRPATIEPSRWSVWDARVMRAWLSHRSPTGVAEVTGKRKLAPCSTPWTRGGERQSHVADRARHA
jgi:DNA-directed RNA polymerase specialized sigma24 family protein